MRRSCIDIGVEAPLIDDIDFHSLDGTRQYVRFLLHEMLAWHYAGLHLFYNEQNDCVQVCLWKRTAERDVWDQEIPMHGTHGRQVLNELRRMTRRKRAVDCMAEGRLHYRSGGVRRSLEVVSPHEWDVRLYTDEHRPGTLPYTLVFAGADETRAIRDGVGAG